MFVHVPPVLPRGCTPARPDCEAGRWLASHIDGQQLTWNDTPRTPVPPGIEAALAEATPSGLRVFGDGSALLVARHQGQAFFLPWPVRRPPHHVEVEAACARAGWQAYTTGIAVFPWRSLEPAMGEEDLAPLLAQLEDSARAAAGLAKLAGVAVDTLSWSLSHTRIDEQGHLTPPEADISGGAVWTSHPDHDRILEASFQAAQDRAHQATTAFFSDPTTQLRAVRQGWFWILDSHNERPSRHDAALTAITDRTVSLSPPTLHQALSAWPILAPFLPEDPGIRALFFPT